jgi:hypothetical protein
MNANCEQEPFSAPEWVAGSMAMAAVALIALLAFQRISPTLSPGLTAGPSNATQRPEIAPPEPLAKVGQCRRHRTTRDAPAGESPVVAVTANSAPAPGPGRPAEAPTLSIGLLDLFRMRNAIVAPPPTPTADSPAPREAAKIPPSLSDAIWNQTALRELGSYAGSMNGIWGPASRRALRDFSRQ